MINHFAGVRNYFFGKVKVGTVLDIEKKIKNMLNNKVIEVFVNKIVVQTALVQGFKCIILNTSFEIIEVFNAYLQDRSKAS